MERSAVVYTHENCSYLTLGTRYNHATVGHSRHQYVGSENPEVHTNSIESFWAWFKQIYNCMYHHGSKEHQHRCINEICGRFNRRKLSVLDWVRSLMRGLEGKSFLYRNRILLGLLQADLPRYVSLWSKKHQHRYLVNYWIASSK